MIVHNESKLRFQLQFLDAFERNHDIQLGIRADLAIHGLLDNKFQWHSELKHFAGGPWGPSCFARATSMKDTG